MTQFHQNNVVVEGITMKRDKNKKRMIHKRFIQTGFVNHYKRFINNNNLNMNNAASPEGPLSSHKTIV